jgi:hypothetical protein
MNSSDNSILLKSFVKRRRRQLFDALEDDRRALITGDLILMPDRLVFQHEKGRAIAYPLQRLVKVDGPGLMGSDLILLFDNGGSAWFIVEQAKTWVERVREAQKSAPALPGARPPVSESTLHFTRLAIIISAVYLAALPCLCLCSVAGYYIFTVSLR